MAKAGYCRHGTYIGHNQLCWQCMRDAKLMKENELHEWLEFKAKVRKAMEEIGLEKLHPE